MASAKRRVTKRIVDAMTPGETVWDIDVPGFCVRCRDSEAKSYGLKYREGTGRGGRQRWFTIGRHGAPWTVETARKEALRLRAAVANGATPMADVIAERLAPSVSYMLDQWLEDHVKPKRKPRTAVEYKALIEIARPVLGALKVQAVKRADIARLHHDWRHTPTRANRILSMLSAAFGWAERIGYRDEGTNPAQRIERYREIARDRYLSEEELLRLGHALRQAEEGHARLAAFEDELRVWRSENEAGRARAIYRSSATRPRKPDVALFASPFAVAAIRLLLLTGARMGEVLGLRWAWMSMNMGLVTLPDSKTGKKTIELPPAAIALLHDLPRVEGNPYVIVGEREGAALVNLEKPWRRIRAHAGLGDVRLHDLRHTYASKAIGAGYSLRVAGSLLGHTQAATTQRYAHVADTVRRRAAETVGAAIAAALAGDVAPAEDVVRMVRRA